MSTTEIMELADLYYHNPYREGSHTHLVYADQKRAALLKAVEEMAADAARYQFIRNGGAYIEPNHYDEDGKQIKEMYMATETGKYYTDMRDFDMDLNEAMQKETP